MKWKKWIWIASYENNSFEFIPIRPVHLNMTDCTECRPLVSKIVVVIGVVAVVAIVVAIVAFTSSGITITDR